MRAGRLALRPQLPHAFRPAMLALVAALAALLLAAEVAGAHEGGHRGKGASLVWDGSSESIEIGSPNEGTGLTTRGPDSDALDREREPAPPAGGPAGRPLEVTAANTASAG